MLRPEYLYGVLPTYEVHVHSSPTYWQPAGDVVVAGQPGVFGVGPGTIRIDVPLTLATLLRRQLEANAPLERPLCLPFIVDSCPITCTSLRDSFRGSVSSNGA